MRLHWPKHNTIYRFIAKVVEGLEVVDKNRHFYILHINEERCRNLINKINNATLVEVREIWRQKDNGAPMVELKVYK